MNRLNKFMNNPIIKEFWNCEDNGFLCMPKGDLYHYTSANVVNSIMNNNEFWVTKASFMNDRSEVDYSLKLFIERIEKSTIDQETQSKLKTKIYDKANSGYFDNIYILCFSKKHDSLPMWSYYGNNDGYNIGFSREFVSDFVNHEFIQKTEQVKKTNGELEVKKTNHKRCVKIETKEKALFSYTVKANHVLYNESKQVEIFDLIIEEIKWCIENNKNYTYILGTLIDFLTFFKSKHYQNEDEYRIVIRLDGTSYKELELSKIQNTRTSNGALVPYIIIKFNKMEYIKSITLSPLNKNEFTVKGVKDLVSSYGNKIEIIETEIPSRF